MTTATSLAGTNAKYPKCPLLCRYWGDSGRTQTSFEDRFWTQSGPDASAQSVGRVA